MKATANIATYQARVDNRSLQKTIDSIYNQFDVIRIYFNGYKKAPPLHDPLNKIQKITGNIDLTDNGKFAGLDTLLYHERYFTLDDDIQYPSNYREQTELALDKYGCIVTYHGRQLQQAGVNYYTAHKCFRCFDTVQGDQVVDVCGTGVTAFDTRYFLPKGLAMHELKKMSDLIFSLEAAKQRKQIGCIGHTVGWIRNIDNKETIFDTESKGKLEHQNRIADEIYLLNQSK